MICPSSYRVREKRHLSEWSADKHANGRRHGEHYSPSRGRTTASAARRHVPRTRSSTPSGKRITTPAPTSIRRSPTPGATGTNSGDGEPRVATPAPDVAATHRTRPPTRLPAGRNGRPFHRRGDTAANARAKRVPVNHSVAVPLPSLRCQGLIIPSNVTETTRMVRSDAYTPAERTCGTNLRPCV